MQRFIWVVGVIGFLLSSVAVADVIIFTNGSRLEVQSYEVKGGLVLFRTLEGKLQSVPQAYVNLSATERANRGAPVSAPAAAEEPKPTQPPQPPQATAEPTEHKPPEPERPAPPPAEPIPPEVERPAATVPETPPPVWSDEQLKISVVIPSAQWRVETQSASFDVAVRLDNVATGARATLALVRERMRDYGDFQAAVREIERSVASSVGYQSLGSEPLRLDPYTAHEIRYLKNIGGATYYNRMVIYYSRDMAYVLSMSCPQDELGRNEADFDDLVDGVVIKKVRKDITPDGAPG
jgi:outer membrane biosynthesis protein TonB